MGGWGICCMASAAAAAAAAANSWIAQLCGCKARMSLSAECPAVLVAGHDSEAWKQIGPYMRKYGRHAIANSQLFNPEYIHFYVPGLGSIAYIIADM